MSFLAFSSNRFLFGHYRSLKKEIEQGYVCCRNWWAAFKVGIWRPSPLLRTPASTKMFSLESACFPWRKKEGWSRHRHSFTCSHGCFLTHRLFPPLPPPYPRVGIADPDPSHARRGRNQDLGQWELSLPRRNLNPATSIIFLNADPVPQGLPWCPNICKTQSS